MRKFCIKVWFFLLFEVLLIILNLKVFYYLLLLMPNWLGSYTPSSLQFSSSKLFFQHQNQILQNIWFISPISIDIHFKYTFQEVQSDYFIEWGEFEWLTVDHDVHEQWIIYKIWFLNPKYQNIQHLSLDLNNNVLDNPSLWPLVGWLLWWWVVFGLLMWLYGKWQFWHVLFWLNVIGGWILLCFLMWKVAKVLYNKFVNTTRVDYWWFTVNYANQSDALVLSPEVIKTLKGLGKDYWITKFCCTWNCIYLLQDVHDREWNRVSSSSKMYSEQEKASLQQRTLDYIHQSEFLSLFTLT